MYKLPHFTEQDKDLIVEFINANPFATLIGSHGNVPVGIRSVDMAAHGII